MIDVDFVISVHDEILTQTSGLPGLAGQGRAGVESALARIDNRVTYEGLRNVFSIAALYAEAIARGHVFNDGNKRTALACAITYLSGEGFEVISNPELEQLTVDLAKGVATGERFAMMLATLAGATKPFPGGANP